MGSKRNADNSQKENVRDSKESRNRRKATVKTPSLKTLINWNISKALKSDPRMDLRAALRQAQERLESSRDVETLVCPDAHNLSCALLAWQQLGHRNADSLFKKLKYKCSSKERTTDKIDVFMSSRQTGAESHATPISFVQQTLKEESERKQTVESLRESVSCERENPCWPQTFEEKDSIRSACQWGGPAKMDFSTSIGLVVKLPSEPQTLMHLAGPVRVPKNTNKCCSRKTTPCATINKIDSACCLDDACMDQLTSIGKQTQELRRRAATFAKREAERAELLERAEMAWRDLDSGYQRRLRIAKEKEEEYEKQTARMLDERNRYKAACMPLVDALKKKSALAEREQDILKQLEQAVCIKACERLQLAEQDARINSQLTEHQCRASQLDRNLALKEEQERRKQRSLAGEAEAAQLLTHEAEYAQRNELAALRAQVQQASRDLLDEDERTKLLRKRIDDYLAEKNEMIEDLETCQTKCDGRMSGLTNDLKSKKEKIAELQAKVMECLCKEPVDRAVEVRRTPSLAALCRCTPSEMLQGTCSCTSVRSRLLSSLLKDLFGGLKAEMESIGSQMPCHLLKCLEDKHNWDRSTDVKTNVRAYFSQLLLGELDIAIGTVIEKCHAQWVGECCADLRKPQMPDSRHSLRWQEHDLEMKTQKMATKIAEKMFLEKAKELAKQAEENLTKDGHPPCECDLNASESTGKYSSAVYRCQVHTRPTKLKTAPTITSDNLHRRDKTMAQPIPIGSLKKDTNGTINTLNPTDKNKKKDVNNLRPGTTTKNNGTVGKSAATRKIAHGTARKVNKSVLPKGDIHRVELNVANKVFKGPQRYSVNMCLCDNKKHLNSSKSRESCQVDLESSYNPTFSSPISSLRQSKPILLIMPEKNCIQESDETSPLCTEKGACLHKIPSNTSIDRLISILTKWKDNLVESQDSNIRQALSTDSLFKITHRSIINILQQLGGKTSSNYSITKAIDDNFKSLQDNQITVDKENLGTLISNELAKEQSQNVETVHLNDSLYKNRDKAIEQYTSSTIKPVAKKTASVEVNISFDPTKSYTDFAKPGTPINKKNNTEINYMEKLSVINNSQLCGIRHEEVDKCIQCLGVTLANVNKCEKQQNQNNESSHVYQRIKGNINRSVAEQKNSVQNNEVIEIEKFPSTKLNNKSENYIQFLGVTLDNAKSKQNVRMKERNGKFHLEELLTEKRKNENNKAENKLLHFNAIRDLHRARCAYKRIKAVNILHVHNECAITHRKDNQLTDKKSIEVQNNSNNILTPESCVCCPTLNTDSSNDLEVNTFQLLEDHLKCKLEEFKNSVCKSSCIQKVDKKTLFGDTLLKVKKLILESASSVSCKCVGNSQSNGGSWNRAYSLLQEYLKTKIEHVKCLCNSPEDNKAENLVPHVLSKINCLIESDLQRLKDICKCNDTKSDVIDKTALNFTHEPQCIGEVINLNTSTKANATDTNNLSTSQMLESMLVSYTEKPELSSLPYDKSAQVLLHRSVLTKSCDALRTYSKYSEVQTVETLNTNLIVNETNTETNYDYSSLFKETKDESTQDDKTKTNLLTELQENDTSTDNTRFQKGDVTVLPVVISSGNKIVENDLKDTFTGYESSVQEVKINDSGNIKNKIDEVFLPYVGCTINCSCDSNLGCVCTKSTVSTNNKLNEIWKTFTQKPNATENVSYILNKMSSKIPDDLNSIDVTDDFHATDVIQVQNLRQCDPEIDITNDKDIYPNIHRKRVELRNDYYKTEIQVSKTKMCETEVSASEEKNVFLKNSKQSLYIGTSTSATNTLTDDYSLQSISTPLKSKHQGILKRNKYEFKKYAPIYSGKSDTTLMSDHSSHRSKSCATDCDCDCAMVPICHVKMLVENIGNKLVKAECTCDSLKSVCPIHS